MVHGLSTLPAALVRVAQGGVRDGPGESPPWIIFCHAFGFTPSVAKTAISASFPLRARSGGYRASHLRIKSRLANCE